MQTCMQKFSKKLTTFIDHSRKGESLWLKKFKKNIDNDNIISKREFSLGLKFRNLCLRIKKTQALWQEKIVSPIYGERAGGESK